MKMSEITIGQEVRVRQSFTRVEVVEKNLRTDWHRNRPRTSVKVKFLEGIREGQFSIMETRHLNPIR